MVRCWLLVQGTKQRSFGVSQRGKESQSGVVIGSAVFDIRLLVNLNSLPSQQNIEIYNPGMKECITSFKGHGSITSSLVWTPDGTPLPSADVQGTIREWDSLTWQQVGHPCEGHTDHIYAIALTLNSTGTLVASASKDKHVRLWRFSDQRTIAIFQHSSTLTRVTFSVDGKHILSGGFDNKVSEWAVPKEVNSKVSLYS
jgi:WD40 repeat protein